MNLTLKLDEYLLPPRVHWNSVGLEQSMVRKLSPQMITTFEFQTAIYRIRFPSNVGSKITRKVRRPPPIVVIRIRIAISHLFFSDACGRSEMADLQAGGG